MTPTSRRALNAQEKKRFNLTEDQQAFEFTLDKVIEERCDEFENELEFEGYEILETEHTPIAASIFNFRVIAKLL